MKRAAVPDPQRGCALHCFGIFLPVIANPGLVMKVPARMNTIYEHYHPGLKSSQPDRVT